jgi:hypothetical protein
MDAYGIGELQQALLAATKHSVDSRHPASLAPLPASRRPPVQNLSNTPTHRPSRSHSHLKLASTTCSCLNACHSAVGDPCRT